MTAVTTPIHRPSHTAPAESTTNVDQKAPTAMLRSELYKLRHHRTPWVILAATTLFASIPSIWFLFRATDGYVEIPMMVLTVAAALLTPVFGAWVMGHEYRQGTLKRVVALDGRRNALVLTKGVIAVVGTAIGLLIAAGVAIGISAVAASMRGDTLVFDGFGRSLGAAVFAGVFVAAVAYLVSVILRSDTYAIIGTIGVMSLFGQLLALVPRVGQYMPPVAMGNVVSEIAAPGELASGDLNRSILSLAVTLVVGAIAARQLFAARDL